MHLFRIVPIHDGPHQPGESWMGDSIGRWDGDAFVIDTVGFNLSTVGGTGDRHQPYRHSEQLHMIERIRRIDLNTIEIETRLEDPKVFEGRWGWTSRYAYHPEFKRVEEYMCAENPKDYDYLLDSKKEIKLPEPRKSTTEGLMQIHLTDPPQPPFPLPAQPQQTAHVQAPMVYVYEKQRWEYKLIVQSALSEGELNALGAGGWELVGVIGLKDTSQFYFKRVRT